MGTLSVNVGFSGKSCLITGRYHEHMSMGKTFNEEFRNHYLIYSLLAVTGIGWHSKYIIYIDYK